MKRDIYIMGAGGQAKDTLCLISDINASHDLYHFRGFVSIGDEREVRFGAQTHPVYDESVFLNEMLSRDTLLALGSGGPKLNQEIVEKIPIPGLFPNLIHPSFIGNRDGIVLSEGNLIAAGNIWTSQIEVGSYNVFNVASLIGHDSTIGSFNVFNPGCRISGGTRIGDSNLIGTGSTVLQYLEIGDSAIIGGGAVVTKDVASHKVVVGVPAKVIKGR
jgi:sugar O-acyltransferase (sialic acid O-acetyltransferase NeuD family)